MTTAQWLIKSGFNDDAGLRIWGTTLNQKLTALGLVQTADTGQINWNTATFPANSYVPGYEIWRFDDALQATAPIVFKLRYYHYGFGAVPPQLVLSVATGSDGAGNLTGVTSGEIGVSNNGTASGPSLMCYGSMVNGKLSIALNPTAASVETFFAIHRTNDANGDPTATGCIIVTRGNVTNANAWVTCLNFPNAVRTQSNVQNYNALQLGNLAATPVGTSYRGSILVGAYPQALAHIGLFGFIEGMFAQGATFKATLFGSTEHTYIAMPGLLVYLCSTQRIAMLWE